MPTARARRDLLVAGHVNVDRHVRLSRFPGPDRTEPVLAERTELGGTATNLVLVAQRLGVRTGILARVGDGFPDAFRRSLQRRGVDLRGLGSVRSAPTPSCTILEDAAGSTRTIIQQGPMGDGIVAPLPGAWIGQYRWLHLSTGNPEQYLRLAAFARRRGLRVALDPAQEIFYRWDRRHFRSALARVEILFGNRLEIACAERLVGGATERLLALVPLVVRTEGARGATAFFRGGRVHVPAVTPKRRRSFVGAGDSFRGGFYAAWLPGRPLAACLEAGVRSAAAWIEGAR